MTDLSFHRRHTHPVMVGNTPLGADNPIRIQSMTNTSTMNTDDSVNQCVRMAEAGAEYIRLTAQGVREADNLGNIRALLRERGVDVPLVADIHFNPKAAFAAADNVEKVRINPGNFVDPGRTFRNIEYTDAQYAEELNRIEKALVPFLKKCSENSVAIRIGVNHGSLSDRIMSRFGNTPAGMAESAMEFLRVCVKYGFKNVVVSMKASNTVVMVESVRRLVEAMEKENMHFPLHLGVTEAGDGEDGRIKSAVGIGALLAEGIGDTIRVSLSEPPENELPVAHELVEYIAQRANCDSHEKLTAEVSPQYNFIAPVRGKTVEANGIGGDLQIAVVMDSHDNTATYDADRTPDIFGVEAFEPINALSFEITNDFLARKNPILLFVPGNFCDCVGAMKTAFHRLLSAGCTRPVAIELSYNNLPDSSVTLRAAADFGALLLSGFGDAIKLNADKLSPRRRADIAFGILQAARCRFTKTEFISCPGCGRTLFNLEETVKTIKDATSHLKGLKIGIMGCIVNGPGEMADAHFGYVGAGANRVSLYKGKQCIEKNIPSQLALPRLIEILKEEGLWIDKPQKHE